jgi:hypothetical protein
MPYTITWETWKDMDGCHEFMETRKANLQVTTIIWVVVGWEADPEMSECVWYKRSPILLWLN